jgi:hypothetical protein
MISLILTLIVVGVLLYCINRFVPMDANIKQILNIVVILCVVVWLLNIFGVFSYLGNTSVPHLHR